MDTILSISVSPKGNYLALLTLRNALIYDIHKQKVIYPETINSAEICPILSSCWFPNEEIFVYSLDSKKLVALIISDKSTASITFNFLYILFLIYYCIISVFFNFVLEPQEKYMEFQFQIQMIALFVLINMVIFLR